MLCEIIGYNVSNLHNAIEGRRNIPDKWLNAFEVELSYYGFLSAPDAA
jgi:hypothetical protein